jgi:hypothetical protein
MVVFGGMKRARTVAHTLVESRDSAVMENSRRSLQLPQVAITAVMPAGQPALLLARRRGILDAA